MRFFRFLFTTPYLTILTSTLMWPVSANAQDWHHSRSEIHVAAPMHLHIGVEPPHMVFAERESYNSRGYGQTYYQNRSSDGRYDSRYDHRSYGRSYGRSSGNFWGSFAGGVVGATIGSALQRPRYESAPQIVYAQPLSQREYVPYREEVRDPTVLMINATPWPVMVINRSNNTNAILAAGQSAQMDDGDITGLVDMRGKYHQACVQRTLTGWTFTFPDVHP